MDIKYKNILTKPFVCIQEAELSDFLVLWLTYAISLAIFLVMCLVTIFRLVDGFNPLTDSLPIISSILFYLFMGKVAYKFIYG